MCVSNTQAALRPHTNPAVHEGVPVPEKAGQDPTGESSRPDLGSSCAGGKVLGQVGWF